MLQVKYHLYHLYTQVIKFTLKFLCVKGSEKFTQIWIKFGVKMCHFLYVTQISIILYMYKHETIRNRLIGYLTYQLIKIWKQPLN